MLMVNDDGFSSEWLALLCRTAADRGHRVTVVAPANQQSAKSHSFTINSPLIVREGHIPGAGQAYIVEGTPVDCARLGLFALTEEPVDLVVSGINQGYNIGLATYVSGTVGAAREGAFLQNRALAVSAEPRTSPEMLEFFAKYAVRCAEKLLTWKGPAQAVCNLNAPCCKPSEIRGAKVCPISRLLYKDGYEERSSPRGVRYFWLKPEESQQDIKAGTDLDLLAHNWLTITFLTPDPCDQSEWADFPPAL